MLTGHSMLENSVGRCGHWQSDALFFKEEQV